MDLSQQKLTGKEWDSLERPVSKSELRILRLIKEGYQNVTITFNYTQSLINFVKISENTIDGLVKSQRHQLLEKFGCSERRVLKGTRVSNGLMTPKSDCILHPADFLRVHHS